jgi:hypothetical protein
MTPEQLAVFAATASTLPAEHIDRAQQVIISLEKGTKPITIPRLVSAWSALCAPSDDDDADDMGDEALDLLIDVLAVDPSATLGDKFLDVLEKANIVLTSAPPTTTPSIGRPESIDSIDSNDPLWKQAVALDCQRLAGQALDLWRQEIRDRHEAYIENEDGAADKLADSIYRARLGKKVVKQWRWISAQRQADWVFAERLDARRVGARVMKKWVIATREKIFYREMTRVRAENFIAIWRRTTREVREMDAMAKDLANQRAAARVLSKMVTQTRHVAEQEDRAVTIYHKNIAQKIFVRWLARLSKIREDEVRADAAADYHAGKHLFQKLREKAQARIAQDEAQSNRTHLLCVKYFHKWQKFTQRSKIEKYKAAYKSIRRMVKRNLAQSVMNIWRLKTKRIQGMNATAEIFRAEKDNENARKMAHSAIVTMYKKMETMKQAAAQAELFYTKNLVDRFQLFGLNWLGTTRQIMGNQQRADEFRDAWDKNNTLGHLRNWNNKAWKIRRMEEDADALRERHEKRRDRAMLQNWRAKANAMNATEDGHEPEQSLLPITPAVKRSQLLASTTPAYTPAASALFGIGSRLTGIEDEDDE